MPCGPTQPARSFNGSPSPRRWGKTRSKQKAKGQRALAATRRFLGETLFRCKRSEDDGLSEIHRFVKKATFADEHGSGKKDKGDTHNEYESVVDRCYSELLPRWKDLIADTQR